MRSPYAQVYQLAVLTLLVVNLEPMADRDSHAFRNELRFGGPQIPWWISLACAVLGTPFAIYGFGHIAEWPRRGPGGGEGANHLAVFAAIVGGVLLLTAALALGVRLARWLAGR